MAGSSCQAWLASLSVRGSIKKIDFCSPAIMGDSNGCKGDTWLVDTLNWCQSLQGRARDRESGNVSLQLLAFLFSLLFPPSPPLSLLSSILFPLAVPLSPPWPGKDSEPLLATCARCSLASVLLAGEPASLGAGARSTWHGGRDLWGCPCQS